MRVSAAALCFLLLTMAAGIVACGGGASPGGTPVLPTAFRAAESKTRIKHVVVVIQENRSFDNFFATFPGADGTKTGKAAAMSSSEQTYCAR